MSRSPFFEWIDHAEAAKRQHAEIARLTGVGNGRMLDMAAGDGSYLGYFQKHGWECLGIEEDEHLAAQAFQNHEVLTLQGAPTDVGLPRDSYDVVRIRGLLNEAEDPGEIVHIARHAVIPTGYVIAETWNHGGWPVSTGPSRRQFTRAELEGIFQSAGLEVGGIIAPALGDETWFPVTAKRGDGPNRFAYTVNKFLGWLDRGPMLVVFAQRPPAHSSRETTA